MTNPTVDPNQSDDSEVVLTESQAKRLQEDSDVSEWPVRIPPEQRVNAATTLFFKALATLCAYLPTDADSPMVQDAIEQIRTAFEDLRTASDEYKDNAEIFEIVYNFESAKHDALQERCKKLLDQNKLMATVIHSTADHLISVINRIE